MPIIVTQYPATLVPGQSEYNKIFFDYDDAQGPLSFEPLVDTLPTDKLTDFASVLTDVARIPERAGPTADMEELLIEEAWTYQIDVVEYAAQFSCPKVHWKALPVDLRNRYPVAFANSSRETLEWVVWTKIVNMFTDLGPDGVEVVSDSHPSPAGVWSNSGSVAFSASALAAAFAAMVKTPSPQGRLASGVRPRFIVHGLELSKSVYEALNASSAVDDNGNMQYMDVNFLRSYGLTPISSPHYSSATTWALVADPNVSGALRLAIQTAPTFASGLNDEAARYWGNVDMAFGVGWRTPRGVWGSNP